MNATKILKCIILVTLSLLFSACASTIVMQDKFDVEAERFQPREGKANIYVVRESSFAGSAYLFQVLLNGNVHGAIAPGTYLLLEVPTGPHAVAVITQENYDSENIEAVAGENYFVEISPIMGWLAVRASVERIDEARGRQLVIDGKRGELMITGPK